VNKNGLLCLRWVSAGYFDEWDMLLLLKNDQKASFWGKNLLSSDSMIVELQPEKKHQARRRRTWQTPRYLLGFFFEGSIRLCLLNGGGIEFDFFI
jgi:hypothetical protein